MKIQLFIKVIAYLLIILVNHCSSSALLDRFRKHKTITYRSSLSSPSEFNINEGSKFRLTCTFLSNFDQIDLLWFHNGTLIESFMSKPILDEEDDDDIDNLFLAVTIISTIEIEKTHLDLNGLYHCVGIHNEIYSVQNFDVHVIANGTNSIQTNFSEDALITLHTHQSLFEPRHQTLLMCRFGENRKNQCQNKWFDPEFELIDTLDSETDLIIKNANFDDHMGLYTCQICCHQQCQTLTSFVYPAGSNK
jgi:hypothetical protein